MPLDSNLFDDAEDAGADPGIKLNAPAPKDDAFDDAEDNKNRNLFDDAEDLPVKKTKGLDKEREVQHLPGGDTVGSVLAGMNKMNPFVLAPKAGAWLMNKALTASGVQAADNPDVYSAVDKTFIPNPEGTTWNKAADVGGQAVMVTPEIGAGLVRAGAENLPYASSLAERNAPILKKMANSAKNLGVNVVHGMSESPSAPIKYALQNTTSGVGLGLAHEATKDDPWYVRAPAVIAGGVVGGNALTAPAGLAKGVVNNYIKYISPVGWTARLWGDKIANTLPDGSKVGEYLRDYAQKYAASKYDKVLPDVAQNIKDMGATSQLDEAARLRDTIPGFNPSLAEATGLTSQVANQKLMENSSTGSVLDNFVKRKQDSEQAISDFAAKQAPAGNGADVSDAAQRRVAQVVGPIKQQQAAIRAKQESMADALPDAKAYDTGSYLRDKLETSAAYKQKEMSELFNNTVGNAANLRVSRDGIQKAVQSALPSKLAANTSPMIKRILNLDNSEPLNFNDAKYMMEQLGQEARLAAKQGNTQDARIIGSARDNMDNYLQNEWAPALKIGDKYKAWRATYKNEYIDRFASGAAKDVSSVGGDMRYRTDNEDVAGKFWKPGDVTAAKDFHRTFAGDPQAEDALHSYALDDLRQNAVKDGVLDPKALNKWMTANKDNLAQFPTFQQKVSDMHQLARSLADRQATLAAREEAVGNSQLAKTMNDNKTTVDTLLSDPSALKRVTGVMKPEEKQALAREMWTRATQGGDSDPAAMKEFLNANNDALNSVLSKDHIKALNDIQKAWEMNANVPAPTGKGETPVIDKFKDVTGSSPQQLLSRGFAVVSGRVGKEYAIGDLFTRLGLNVNNKQSQAIMQRAMYDANFAKELANFTKQPKPSPQQLQGMKSYIFNSGISAIRGKDDEDDGDR